MACEKDREREETIRTNEWKSGRFQRRVEVDRERMKLLLKLREPDLHIPVNVTYNESLPGNSYIEKDHAITDYFAQHI